MTTSRLPAASPASRPPGFAVVLQAWQADRAGPAGFAATNGLRGQAP